MVVREGSATPHAICARESGAGRATDPTAPCAPPPPPPQSFMASDIFLTRLLVFPTPAGWQGLTEVFCWLPLFGLSLGRGVHHHQGLLCAMGKARHARPAMAARKGSLSSAGTGCEGHPRLCASILVL